MATTTAKPRPRSRAARGAEQAEKDRANQDAAPDQPTDEKPAEQTPAAPEPTPEPEASKPYLRVSTRAFDRFQGVVTRVDPDGTETKVEDAGESRFGHITQESALAHAKTDARKLGLEIKDS